MSSSRYSHYPFHILRNSRIAARDALSAADRSLYDVRLTQLFDDAILTGRTYRIRRITKLLDKGAALHYDSHELGTSNLTELVDHMQESTCEHHTHYILNLVDNIITSACNSWLTNRLYVGNGGMEFPYFLMDFVATGDMYGYYPTKTALRMHHRQHAWSVLKNMVWVYEHDRCIERSPVCEARLVTKLLIQFLRAASKRCQALPLTHPENDLYDSVVAFFRTSSMISKSMICKTIRYERFGVYSIELLLRIDPNLYQRWVAGSSSQSLFNNLLYNRPARKQTLRLLAYEQVRVSVLQPDHIRDLCRRKERVIFERLYQIDPKRLRDVIPFALQVLESNFVRGRKERLIALLKGIQSA